jgi:hypothetical protein
MRTLAFQKVVNPEKLDGELRNLLTPNLDGVVFDGIGKTLVTLTVADLDSSLDAQVLTVVNAHNPALTPLQSFEVAHRGLVVYFRAIIASFYADVDNGGVTLTQMLNNAAAIVATNPTQLAKFNAYRTRLGLGAAIGSLTATQQGQLLELGLEWATAGLLMAITAV